LTTRASHIERVDELIALLESSGWFKRVVAIAALVDPPEWWISAGVIRDLVWGERLATGFDPAETKDVDLAFFDADDVATERDNTVERDLRSHDSSVPGTRRTRPPCIAGTHSDLASWWLRSNPPKRRLPRFQSLPPESGCAAWPTRCGTWSLHTVCTISSTASGVVTQNV
jgi:hypothetical protein